MFKIVKENILEVLLNIAKKRYNLKNIKMTKDTIDFKLFGEKGESCDFNGFSLTSPQKRQIKQIENSTTPVPKEMSKVLKNFDIKVEVTDKSVKDGVRVIVKPKGGEGFVHSNLLQTLGGFSQRLLKEKLGDV